MKKRNVRIRSTAGVQDNRHGRLSALAAIVLALAVAAAALTACDTGGGGGSDFIIANTAQWNTAMYLIQTGGNYRNYVLTIVGTVPVPPSSFGTARNITVTLRGNGILTTSADGALFRFAGGSASYRQTLIIDGPVTLVGRNAADNGANNTAPVVYLYSNAALEMKNGTITGNASEGGGGVYVQNGSFTMSGGKISGNTAQRSGGGVSVSGGTFTMTGGVISSNTAQRSGGGVDVVSGAFTMTGGVISGNTTTNDGGGGVSVYGGTSTMTGGEISGNTAANSGGGVLVWNGSFAKSGGTIYGDTDTTHNPGDPENTATGGGPGHAVFYHDGSGYYYRNDTLGTGDDISTDDSLPTTQGQTVGKWTRQ